MKQEGPKTYKRVVYTPKRDDQSIGLLNKGLDFSKDPDKIEKNTLSSCDGFILYLGVLKKDWNVTDSANVTGDNITITAKASVETCSA